MVSIRISDRVKAEHVKNQTKTHKTKRLQDGNAKKAHKNKRPMIKYIPSSFQ